MFEAHYSLANMLTMCLGGVCIGIGIRGFYEQWRKK